MFLMGDLRYWSNDTNSRISEESQLSPAAAPTSSSKFWMKGEEGTACIIGQVQPTLISEQRRNAVIEYVQRLIKTTHGCEVFPFGSVPLKTYLPDGDIDLTAFGAPHAEETLVNQVFSVLEKEEENDSAPFVVKDVQLIRAEVKLVKCLVQNIVVDISFNQLGGLCTLCFLEKVDGLIGKDHLFKRSIILIKAWCYYESRILGAHHGLISTYALETLVLYIFHLFHTSLDGPLVVLYKFLDYFSKFDWDNYGISLKGPVRLSSLPELVVETLEISGGDLLLTDDFLKECLDIYSLPSIGVEATSRRFPRKHLNIVDPLKENNNLGRSVNKGNFYRIRSAFTYGSQKLGRVLSEPEDNVAAEVRKFFSNTLDRHGSGQRPDVQDLIPSLGYYASGAMPPFSGAESAPDNSCQEDRTMSENISLGPTEPSLPRDGFVGDAKSLAITSIQQLTITTDSDTSFSTDRGVHGFPLIKPFSPLHHVRNGEMLNGMEQPDVSSFDESDAVSDIGPTSDETTGITIQKNGSDYFLASPESLYPIDSACHYPPTSLASWPQEDVYAYNYGNGVTTNLGGAADASNLLSDLRGDYDNQISSLHYGRWWFDYVHNFRIAPMPPPALSQAQSCNSWDIVRHAMPFRQNMMSPMNANRAVCSQTFFPGNPSINLRASFGREKMPKPHGTGTYFPNASHYRDRPFSPRGQHQHPTRSPRNDGRAATHAEAYWGRRSSRERESYSHQSDARRVSSDAHHLGSPEEKELPNASGSMLPPDSVVDSRSISHLSLEGLDTGSNRRPKAGIGSCSPIAGMHKDRTTSESYRLKDENDFPPLSV